MPPPNPGKKMVIAFDAYGTLLSTESIAKKLANHFGDEKAETLAVAWRKYQLEYTWRLNSMGNYHLKKNTNNTNKTIPKETN
jgi:2-haloacid dehalogenase